MTPQLAQIKPGLTRSRMGISSKPVKEKPIDTGRTDFGIRRLDLYRQYYDAMYTFRKERERAAKYFNGDQWHEWTYDQYGNPIREDEYIISQGMVPLKQNVIKSTIRSLEGQFRQDTSKSVVVSRTPEKSKESEMLSNALQCSLNSINNARELDARALEELLISGLPIQRIGYERMTSLKRKEVVVRNVHPNSIFFNGDILDIRGTDIRVIGQLHDWTIESVIVKFAHDEEGNYSKERELQLREIYSANINDYVTSLSFDSDQHYSKDFYVPHDISKCRVIEVWEERNIKVMMIHDEMQGKKYESDFTFRDIELINRNRIAKYGLAGVAPEDVPLLNGHEEYVKKWWYAYYTPYGHILREGETPFWHSSHPYIVLPYPLLDGKIIGLTTDLIDAQRQVNRLLILQDMILKSSAKNPVFIDKDSMDGKTPEQIAEEMRSPGGVVTLDLKQGRTQAPVEMRGASNNMGIPDMIQTYMKMLQDVSGVNPAMQGQVAPSGTSGTLYAQQAQNSTMNSKDIMESFSNLFRRERDMKLLKTIQQYYDSPRMLAISGKSYTETAQLYDPEKVQNIDFDLVIGQTSDSPVYRDVINTRLAAFLEKGLIDLEMYLEQTTDPFASSMLESVRKRKEQAQQDPRAALAGLNGDVATMAGQVPPQQVA